MPAPVLVFDLETKQLAEEVGGWSQVARMGLACAVTQDTATGAFAHYVEADAARLADDLSAAALVVGFNVLRFDYAVLQPYTTRPLAEIPTLDILEQVERVLGFRVGLDSLARATLGTAKTSDGAQAVRWFRAGRLTEVFEYCEQDVAVTRALYEFGRTRKFLKFHDRRGRLQMVPVRW
jgi:DEAD/DEAH box helicase domain-containing protein